MNRRCGSCGAERPATARFCPACGAPTAEHRRVLLDRARAERGRTTRAALAFGVACCAVLFGFVGGDGVAAGGVWATVLVSAAVVFAAALASALLLDGLRASLPMRTSWPWYVVAVPVGLSALAVSLVFIVMLWGAELHFGGLPDAPSAAVVLGAVVLAPLGEEWLCRGAAWRAATVLGSPRAALVLTAILFAFLHGLGGGYLLELPHRFVGGLLLGWLRWRSGSIVPCVIAHGAWNAGAVWLVF